MPEIARLSGGSDCFELAFMEREATPGWAMKLGIRLHLEGLSLSNTIPGLERYGVKRCRSTVHNRVQKAGLQPSPNHVAVDETVIHLNNERYWLVAAVHSETNEFLHMRLYPACTTALTELFLRELREKHDVADALFPVDGAPWLYSTR